MESTYYGEFLDAKILPDKFCPGSGFALNRSFSDIFLILSYQFIQNDFYVPDFAGLWTAMEFYSLFRLVFFCMWLLTVRIRSVGFLLTPSPPSVIMNLYGVRNLEMSQIKAEISLRTNVKLIFHKNEGLQWYQWIFLNLRFEHT